MWDFFTTQFSKSLFFKKFMYFSFLENFFPLAQVYGSLALSLGYVLGTNYRTWGHSLDHLPPLSFSLSLFQRHGLHLDKLSTFLRLSNCCFRVIGGSRVSPGIITEVSLRGLAKPQPALSWSRDPGRQNRLLISQVRLRWGWVISPQGYRPSLSPLTSHFFLKQVLQLLGTCESP